MAYAVGFTADDLVVMRQEEGRIAMYDINEEAAKRAHEANSFRKYKPGTATAEYNRAVEEARKIAENQKQKVNPMVHGRIDQLFDSYCRKLAANMNQSYEIESRVPSMMVAGISNFPTRKKEQQNAARDKNIQERREIQGLLDKIRSTGMGGIRADDPQAVQKLQSKLAGLEKLQETMKAVNAYYRKHKTLDGCPHLSLGQIEKLKANMPKSWKGNNVKPFEAYALSSNNAEIHRIKFRIENIETAKESGEEEIVLNGVKCVENTEVMRIQFVFGEKPNEETRKILKQNGFKWAPSQNAWQRQLTQNGRDAAKRVIKQLGE